MLVTMLMFLVCSLLIYLVLALILARILEASGDEEFAQKIGMSAVWAWRAMLILSAITFVAYVVTCNVN